MFRTSFSLSLLLVATLTAAVGCRASDAERAASAQATATAEARAQETTLTSATFVAADASVDEATSRAKTDTESAFTAERASYRARLEAALDELDKDVVHLRKTLARTDARIRDVRARRDVLRRDLSSLDRSTAQDWAITRTAIERHLAEHAARGAGAEPHRARGTHPGEAGR